MASPLPSVHGCWWLLALVVLASLPARAAPLHHRSQSYRKIEPALVKLYKYRWGSKNDTPSTASGFIIDEAGHLLTNYHAVRDAKLLHVRHVKYGRKYYNVGVDYVDPVQDIAILHVKDFKGFVDEDSKKDKAARPIDVRQAKLIQSKDEALDLELNVLSNPVEHTDIFAPGFPTGYKDIGEVLAAVARPGSAPARSGYDILEMTNTVAPGSSGGIVVDEKSGLLVGMIFGADRHEHLAFALPARLLQQAVKKAELPEGPHEARYSLDSVRADRDGLSADEYYKGSLYQRGLRDEEQETELLDGTLLTRNNDKIPGGRVWAVGQPRGCQEKLRPGLPLDNPRACAFAQVASTHVEPNGNFKLAVPLDGTLEWMLYLEHRAYEMQGRGPFLNRGFPQYFTMMLKPEFYRKSTVLYADQRVVELKWGLAEPEINLSSTSESIAWEMKPSSASWLQAEPTTGMTHRNPRPLKLRYRLAGNRSLDPKTFTQLVFSTGTQEVAEAIDVYAGHDENEYVFFDGVVQVSELSAAPFENVFVTAQIGTGPVANRVRTEDSGRFQIRLKRKDVTDAVVLRVTGDSFEDAREAGLVVHPTPPGTPGNLVQLKVRLKEDPRPAPLQ